MEFSEDDTNILGEIDPHAHSHYIPRNLLCADAPVQTKAPIKSKTRIHNPKKPKPAPQPETEVGQKIAAMDEAEISEPEQGLNRNLVKDEHGFFICKIPFTNHKMAFIIEENKKLFPNAKFNWIEPAQKPSAFEEEDVDFETLELNHKAQMIEKGETQPMPDKIEEENIDSSEGVQQELAEQICNEPERKEAQIQEEETSIQKRDRPVKQVNSEQSPKRNSKKVKTEEVAPRRVSARLQARQSQH